MGGLEYQPARELGESFAGRGGLLDLGALTELAELTLRGHSELERRLAHVETRQDALDLLRVGTSAGGARAKALVALGPGGELKVGYADHGPDHEYWLLKFDGIADNRDRESPDPPGATVVEFIYSELARECGIDLPRTRLLEHEGQRHFLIERFDRVLRNGRWDKLHYTSWCGMAHAHRDTMGAYSYEQLVLTMRQLGLPQVEVEQLFRRAVFNVLGKNHDDHTKNFGFLMDRSGKWRLSPAFDLTYAFDPTGQWTRQHQITLSDKVDDFSRADLLRWGAHCNLSAREAHAIIDKTLAVFSGFGGRARALGLAPSASRLIEGELRAVAHGMKR
jgi:serine/threonine-protein kinase HipA